MRSPQARAAPHVGLSCLSQACPTRSPNTYTHTASARVRRMNHLTGFIGWTLRPFRTQWQIQSTLTAFGGRGRRRHFRTAHGHPHTRWSSAAGVCGSPVPRTTLHENRVMAAAPTPTPRLLRGVQSILSRVRARSKSPEREGSLGNAAAPRTDRVSPCPTATSAFLFFASGQGSWNTVQGDTGRGRPRST